MLTGTSRDFLVEKITARLNVSGRPWFLTFLDPGDAFLSNLPDNPVRGELARTAMRMATQDEGRAYPGVLILMIEELATDPVLAPKLQPILAEAQSYTTTPDAGAGAPPREPLQDRFLEQKLIFWDRKPLRSKLERILPPAGRSILVVNGQSGTGKTYTIEMLTHLKMVKKNAFVLAAVRPPLDPVAKKEATPEALAAEILSAMGVKLGDAKVPPRDGSSMSQFSDLLCRWIFERVPSDQDVYWIVLDGFGIEGVDPWVRAFISRLASKITAGVYQGRIRLILLNYPTDELAAVQDHLEEDTIETPTDDDLKEIVKLRLTERKLQFQESDVDQTLSQARGRVTVAPSDAQYWRQLSRALMGVLYE